MGVTIGLAVAAVGLALIYIGWRGLTVQQFWQMITTSGVAPGKGAK